MFDFFLFRRRYFRLPGILTRRRPLVKKSFFLFDRSEEKDAFTNRRFSTRCEKSELQVHPSQEHDEIEASRIMSAYARRRGGSLYSWFNPGYVFMIQARERKVLEILNKHRFTELASKKFLEVGCGTGNWIRDFIKWGVRPENIVGVDLIPERISEATRLCPNSVKLSCGSATKLDYPEGCFDLVLQSTVFTSVLDPAVRQQIASEMLRVLKKDGLILWYDFHVNSPGNLDTRKVTRKEIHQLFAGCRIEIHRCTLAPPVARWIARKSYFLAYIIEKVPLLRTHYLSVIRKHNPS